MECADCERCVICQDDIPLGSEARLECGHAFHATCVLQWFRHHHSQCPLCRSVGLQSAWRRPSAARRIGGLRAREGALPAPVRRKLRQYDAWRKRLRERASRLASMRRQHATVLREYHAAYRLASEARRRARELGYALESIDMEGVPFLDTAGRGLIDDEDDDDDPLADVSAFGTFGAITRAGSEDEVEYR